MYHWYQQWRGWCSLSSKSIRSTRLSTTLSLSFAPSRALENLSHTMHSQTIALYYAIHASIIKRWSSSKIHKDTTPWLQWENFLQWLQHPTWLPRHQWPHTLPTYIWSQGTYRGPCGQTKRYSKAKRGAIHPLRAPNIHVREGPSPTVQYSGINHLSYGTTNWSV